MLYNKRQVGTDYERVAGEYLVTQGLEILEYNFRCRRGEIDIVAQDGEYLVFCEVKYRRTDTAGHPAEAVDLRKQKRISGCALYYLMKHNQLDVACRFDVVSIEGDHIEHFKNAFFVCGIW